MDFELILASQSPRRSQLLREAGFQFQSIAPQIEEKINPSWIPSVAVQELARQKAEQVFKQVFFQYSPQQREKILILSADTIVALHNEILGKPENASHAYDMLWRLSRQKHRVLTGVCLWPLAWNQGLIGYAETYVTMRPMSDLEIHDYINSGEAMGKAGAYAIQETADRFVQRLDGPWDNVVGLPVDLVRQFIQEWERVTSLRMQTW